MSVTDLAGWIAAALTFGTFACRDMARLRALAVLANLAFITYAVRSDLWPVLALHLSLLPVNLRRLIELGRANRRGRPQPQCTATMPFQRPAFAAALAALMLCPPRTAFALPPAQRAHAQAVEAFRQGRFSEAYGRFVHLANAGHAPAARLALWMCEQGPELFDKDWDCGPEEVVDWASLARVPVPQIEPRRYPSAPKEVTA